MEEWIFTFGDGPNAGKCVRLKGDQDSTRIMMFHKVGDNWAFQYSVEEWEQMKKDPDLVDNLEKEVDFSELII